ncbi:MAG: hypothetical protein ABW321_21095 [Polyangiales bacterium]
MDAWGARIVVIFATGVGVGLLGDACHIASGTTQYAATAWPVVWRSPLWFLLLCGGGVLLTAFAGYKLGLPRVPRTRPQLSAAVAAMVALYALTATMRSQTPTVSVVLTGALGATAWCLWDPSFRCLVLALGAALIATVAESCVAAAGFHRYAPDSQGPLGLAPWLPCLFFAQAVVASGLWRSVSASHEPRA